MFAKTPTVKKSILADTIEENVYNSFKRNKVLVLNLSPYIYKNN